MPVDVPKPVTVALQTLGCKANRCDSDALARALAARGYAIVPTSELADVYIVNTCAVTGEADTKSRKAVHHAVRTHADALIIATGCVATLAADMLGEGAGGARVVVPLAEQAALPDLVLRLRPPGTVGSLPRLVGVPPASHLVTAVPRTRATVKIVEGCDRQCAFCVVRLARGPVRSRPLEDVLAELHALATAGTPEIVLTGIRLDAYGRDLPGVSLTKLLDVTHDLPVARLRLSSLEPVGVIPRLITAMMRHPTLCHHVHLCLQSGDDAVLRAMRRGYTVAHYRALVDALRAAMPDTVFTTDVIVGFPGETEEAFLRTCALVREIGFAKVHVFPFSSRPGTVAADLPGQLPAPVKAQRIRDLIALGREVFRALPQCVPGREEEVLVERTGERGEGLTRGYLRVRAPFPPGYRGRLARVRITGVERDSLLGTAL